MNETLYASEVAKVVHLLIISFGGGAAVSCLYMIRHH